LAGSMTLPFLRSKFNWASLCGVQMLAQNSAVRAGSQRPEDGGQKTEGMATPYVIGFEAHRGLSCERGPKGAVFRTVKTKTSAKQGTHYPPAFNGTT
jgi:hypothetical protein